MLQQGSRQTDKLLAGQIEVLEMIATGASLHESLSRLALVIESQSEGLMASILLLDNDGVRIRHGAAPNLPDSYNSVIDGLSIGQGVGSCGTAMFRQERVVVSDIMNDPLWAPYREMAQTHGLRACWSTPILSPTREILGSFAMYYREVRSPQPEELYLADTAAHTASIAIYRKKTEEALKRDVLARQVAEQQVRELNVDLAKRVELRTAQLLAANRELEAFTYSLSHDLRAPVRVIHGFTELLLEDETTGLDEDGREYLLRIRGAATRMSELIDAMLRLSRVSAVELQLQEVNLSEVAREVAANLQRSNPDRRVHFKIADDIWTSGDRPLLFVMLENLLGNAWKYTSGHAEATIEFGVRPVGSGSDQPRTYFVKDDGAGFDASLNDAMFRPFGRLHTDKEFEGTGLGLATIERIILRHGGRIWAEGSPGHGATFSFTLGSPIPSET